MSGIFYKYYIKAMDSIKNQFKPRNMYSQNQEQKFILEYFEKKGQKSGHLLSIGENDGITLSNTLALIEKGWSAVLIEPSPEPFAKLKSLHVANSRVMCINVAIYDKNGEATLFDSGTHLKKGDHGLLSTLKKDEIKRWDGTGTEFNPIMVRTMTYGGMLVHLFPGILPLNFNFINIDAEGFDMIILKQIDLSNTSLICIEWNLDEEFKKEALEYCDAFGMKELIYQSGENLIIGR